MIVGLIGPAGVVERAHDIIINEHPNAIIKNFIYENYKETLDIVNKVQKNVDGIIFLGKIPYMYAENHLKPKVVWEYIPHDVSAVQGALLKAILLKKWSIEKISIDTYSKKLINEILCELGMSIDNVNIKVMDSKLLDEEYTKHLVDFHIRNYKSNNATCCITGVRSVNKKMEELRIPCILAVAPRKAILSTYSNLEFKYLIKKNRNSQIVVIAIKIDALDIHSVASKDEYSRMINRMQIMEDVYIFASNIEAAVSEISNKEILLFTTRTILETETNNYEEFSLMEMIEKKTFSTVSIGVGYGETANKAKFNALNGMEKASKDSKSSAYVVYNDTSIFKINRKECINSDKKIDSVLNRISEDTSISTEILYRIYLITKKNKIDTFTAKELAELCSINYRSMNRVIQKLESAGYCETVGERLVSNRGRPTRVLKLKYF